MKDEEVPLDQQIVNCIFLAKRERLQKAGGDQAESTLNDTADTSFHERGYDPSRMITSTPRASQERELLWAQSIHAEAQRRGPEDFEEQMELSENDFSP
jgi:hypothetical protein